MPPSPICCWFWEGGAQEANAAIPDSERQTLIALYNSTNGAGWTDNSNWLEAPGTEDTWYGVACSSTGDNVTELSLDNNQLSGNIPTELGSLTALTNLDLNYNALYTADTSLKDFLESKPLGWENRQTIAPETVAVDSDSVSCASALISWTPISYTAGTGGYQVFYSETSDGPYTLFGTTADKSKSQLMVSGLIPETTYYFAVKTKTDPNNYNDNTVYSEYSVKEVSATTDNAVPGDIDNNKIIDLKDAILGLQLLSGMEPASTIYKETDLNGDKKIGMEEVIYILQHVSELRP
ncbi:MAG: fibronectin type III domain-containing protein [Deltaproteobacteria bacterium]|nr:fibronectin type III domain-containing protein [Deltaproteobacteria bacterium]